MRQKRGQIYFDHNPLISVAGTGSAGKNYIFAYDARGNVTGNGSRNFGYNLANQMKSSGSYTYLYDGHNRRVKQVDSKGTSYSFYSQSGQLLYREIPAGGVNYIYLGKKLIAKDGVSPENNARQHYRPFGGSIEGESDDVGYTGHKFDKDLGLSYMQARYYDPMIGRFYSNDPVGYRDVHSFNRYAYANNNSYKFIDPSGMTPSCWDSSAGLCAIGRGKTKEERQEENSNGSYSHAQEGNAPVLLRDVNVFIGWSLMAEKGSLVITG